MALPKPHSFRHHQSERLPRKAESVTVALGFKCQDGIVICADSEMSGGDSFKFKAPKIFMISPHEQWVGDEWVVISTYAGYENIASRVQQLISGKIAGFLNSPDLTDKLREAIESVLAQEYKNHRKDIDSLQMLFAISVRGEKPIFLRSWGKVLSEANVEYVGSGDSSVIRFLAEILCPYPQLLNTQQALMIALYMVSNAKKYVGGCGQETHAVIVEDGTARAVIGKVIEYREAYLRQIETGIADAMRSLFNTTMTKEERNVAIDRFSDEMKHLGKFSEVSF